jgi:hypothetical protein
MDYNITHIAVKNLSVVWPKSQRPFDKKWAEKIAANFDPDKFEPIIVTKPNGEGTYHVVEGQHRKAAFEIWANDDNQKAPCHVIDHGDPAKAAEIWLGVNKGRKGTRPIQEFLIAVEARRSQEVAISEILRRNGYFVNPSSKTPNSISAVSALLDVYNVSERTLNHTLQACRLVWGSDPQGVSSLMLRGFSLFINEFSSYIEPNRMRKSILEKYKSPYRIIEAARIRKDKTSDPLALEIAEIIRRTYNSGLRDEKKLVHKERDK